MAPKKMIVNVPLIVDGPVYANGPVFVMGVDIKKAIEDLDNKLLKLKEEDLRVIKDNLDRLLKEFPVGGQTKSQLEKLRELLEAGKNVTEIINFIKQTWIELGPIITDVLLGK